MKTTLLQPNLVAALGIADLSENDQLVFLSTHGDAIFDRALNRFESLLSEPQQQELCEYLSTEPELEVLVIHLLDTYEQFAPVLEAAAAEVKRNTAQSE
jgi:hypothetical protein